MKNQIQVISRWFLVVLLVTPLLSLSCASTPPAVTEVKDVNIDTGLLDLMHQLMETLGEEQRPVLMVLDFPDPAGQITGLGRYASEELLAHLIREKKLRVVERRFIEKTTKEIEFGMSGLVHEDAAKSIGKLVGADGILTGSYTLIGEHVKLQARIIDVETGELLATGGVRVHPAGVADLIGRLIERAPSRSPGKASRLTQQPKPVKSITAEGFASIRDGNEDLARKNAVGDALRKAIAQGIEDAVESGALLKNAPLVNDRILSRSRAYVRSYQLMSEAIEGSTLRVLVNAEVTLGDLKNDLSAIGVLMERKHQPRIMVMIAEWNVGQDRYHLSWHDPNGEGLSVAENTLIESLSQKGFFFVDPGAVPQAIRQLEKRGRSYEKADLTPAQVRWLGRKLDAEVVIIGKTRASQGAEIKGSGKVSMKSVQSDLSARAVRTDTGAVIASASVRGAAIHINLETAGTKAIEKAAQEMAGKMADQILERYAAEVDGSTQIRLVITGLNHTELTQFKEILKSHVRGVKRIHQRAFEREVARLDIDLQGSAQALAEELSSNAFKDFVVNITTVNANSVRISATKR